MDIYWPIDIMAKCVSCLHLIIGGEGLTHWYACEVEECDREESGE